MTTTSPTGAVHGVEPGALLAGRYRVGALLGVGGMGAVFRARDERRGDTAVEVALKVLKPGLDDDEAIARFRREGDLANVTSPHIVRVLDHGDDGGTLYIVMELVRGVPWKQRLATGEPVPVPLALTVARDVARALVAAHEHGVAHRDVKPANIMVELDASLGGGPRAVLLDFGIARSMEAGATLTSTGIVVGTAGYIAPEVAIGGRTFDARADLYSLGVVLYESLVGAPPFVAANPVALLARQAHEDPIAVRRRAPHVPVDVDALAMQLLARQPARRPSRARAVLAELDALLEGRTLGPLLVDDPVLDERNQYGTLSFERVSRLARFTRTALPFPTADDVGQLSTVALDAFPIETRGDKVLLIDVRDAPMRTDGRFMAIMSGELLRLCEGWRRVATLCATAEGVEQIAALMARAHADANAGLFVDEDAALSYLLAH